MGNFFGNLFYIVTETDVQGLLKGLYHILRCNQIVCNTPLINNLDLIQRIIGRQVDVSNGI